MEEKTEKVSPSIALRDLLGKYPELIVPLSKEGVICVS